MQTANILQPSVTLDPSCNSANPNNEEFMNNLCQALLATLSNDNNARMQAEQFVNQASKSPGCLATFLQIATNQNVSTLIKLPLKIRSNRNTVSDCKVVIYF